MKKSYEGLMKHESNMEAPDEIYVGIGPRQSLIARVRQTLKSDIKYVRKKRIDEILTEAKTRTASIPSNALVYYKEAIDKLNSL